MRELRFRIWDKNKNEWLGASDGNSLEWYGFHLVGECMTVKWLVSVGNLGWMLSGALTGNIPLVVSNAVCLIVMVVEIIRNRKGKK